MPYRLKAIRYTNVMLPWGPDVYATYNDLYNEPSTVEEDTIWMYNESAIVYAQGHNPIDGQGTYRDSIVVINSDTEWQSTVVRGLEHYCDRFDWSPDGTMLAF